MCLFEMSGTGENIVLRTKIHKIDFDSVLKLRDMCIFGSDTPFFISLKNSQGITVLLFSLRQFQGRQYMKNVDFQQSL